MGRLTATIKRDEHMECQVAFAILRAFPLAYRYLPTAWHAYATHMYFEYPQLDAGIPKTSLKKKNLPYYHG